MTRSFWFCLLVICLSLSAPIRAQERAKVPTFVKSEQCRSCHKQEHELWEQSDHSWAWRPATTENVLGDFSDISFEHHGITTRFFTRDNKFWIETNDEKGQPEISEILYSVGVRPLQQYLIAEEGGRLQVLDIAWDTESKKWYMVFPGQTDNVPGNALHWKGVYKNWNGRCAECHATDFKKNYEPRTRSFKSQWSEIGVTCEACHGPGQAHVQWAEKPDIFRQQDYLDIDLKGFVQSHAATPSEIEIQQCAACHSRRSALSGNSPLPGTSFADHYDLALLRPDLYHPDGQIKDEVYVLGSFKQSKMYAAGVTCSNCHNVHSGKIKAEDNRLCTQCHNPAGNTEFPSLPKKTYDSEEHHHHAVASEGGQCVSCHMPTQTYMEVDDRRDHRFGIPNPAQSRALGTPDACISCHQNNGLTWAERQMSKWYPDTNPGPKGFAEVFGMFETEKGTKAALENILTVAEDENFSAIVRASALERALPYGANLPWPRMAAYLRDDSDLIRGVAARLHRQASLQLRLQRLPALLTDDAKTVRFAAARSMLDVPAQALSAGQRQNLKAALREFQVSIVAGADHPNAQMALASLALSLRNAPAARAAISEALTIDPQFTDAWIMLARLDIAEKRPDLATITLDNAEMALPNSPVIQQFYGNYLASQRQFDAAITHLQKAIKLQPDDTKMVMDYGAVLSQAGQHEEALKVLSGISNANADALFLKANALLQLDRKEDAKRTILKLLAQDPGYTLPDAFQQLFSRN
ncbi:tetratricopeptide repeat protein [Sneathiella marina]|uniref:Tetratricopeptide repeat protein n=1 Tax=Sneathiella marina TaxID=2950108 RepID=A0ABY4W1S0_9PROT|nr:tetratricopeptide repeat protein [Sneathiella marina]USG59807.1 tetratricopeptide repeat protein [Sneathiella marina]